MEFFLKHQTVIFRGVGAFMLVLGLSLYFWAAPQKAMSANERAAANLARIEASVSGKSSSSQIQSNDSSQISQAMIETQKKQLRMLMIMVMLFGAGFLGYSFLKKENKEG